MISGLSEKTQTDIIKALVTPRIRKLRSVDEKLVEMLHILADSADPDVGPTARMPLAEYLMLQARIKEAATMISHDDTVDTLGLQGSLHFLLGVSPHRQRPSRPAVPSVA